MTREKGLKFKTKKMLVDISPKFMNYIMYYRAKKHWPNLKNPQKFDEKILYLKLSDHRKDSKYSDCADKIGVREFVKNKGLEDILNEVYGVFESIDQIDFESLPDEFVSKWTNDSASTLVVKNKEELGEKNYKEKMMSLYHPNFYANGVELHYKNIKPRILLEKYLENPNGDSLIDYKLYCYNGKVELIMVCLDRDVKAKFYFVDKEFNLLRINSDGRSADENFKLDMPFSFPEMISSAEILTEGFPFVRADFYDVEGKLYFGEMTFAPSAGFDPNISVELDEYLGQFLEL